MKNLRKVYLILLSILPISSVSFAAEFERQIGNAYNEAEFDFSGEMLRKLEAESDQDMSPYYEFMDKYEIESLETLKTREYKPHLNRMLKFYVDEKFGNNSSVAASLSQITGEH